MVVRLGMARVDEGHFVDVFAQLRENFRNHFAALSARRELERAFHQPTHCVGEEPGEAIEAFESLAIHFLECRLVVPSVDVAGATVDKDPDDGLGSTREVGLLGGQGIGGSEQFFVVK